TFSCPSNSININKMGTPRFAHPTKKLGIYFEAKGFLKRWAFLNSVVRLKSNLQKDFLCALCDYSELPALHPSGQPAAVQIYSILRFVNGASLHHCSRKICLR
ncbi:MAG: hypothetical protein PF589_10980, partial [Gammaproteobacteria bacterium]|nr:hypothetical protein [Gammaproteobacteria bacterium]